MSTRTPLLRHPTVWILAPLALGLLYAAAWPLFAPTPTTATAVPRGAVLAHRFRDLSVVDRDFGWSPGPGLPPTTGRPGDWIGALRNVPGLPGVDRGGTFHWVLLPREGNPDPTLAIFELADAEAFRRMFEDPQLLDLGHVRHAQHLEIRGRLAAVSWDREAVRHLGTSGLVIEDRGEDHALVADVPATLRHALLAPTDRPWRAILDALGYEGDRPVVLKAGDSHLGLGVPAGRVFRVMAEWETLRAWFFDQEGRISVELSPATGAASPLRAALQRAVAAAATPGVPPGLPPRAKAWLWVPTGEARNALGRALFDAGVDLPEGAGEAPAGASGALFAWAEIAPQAVHTWTIGLATPQGALPDLSPWLPGWPAGPGGIDLPAGSAPLTTYDAASDRKPPPLRAARGTVAAASGTLDVAAIGAEADVLLQGGFAPPPAGTEATFAPAPPAAGWALLAVFRLDEPRSRKVLGGELAPRGILAALADGEIAGAAWTDGEKIRVELRRILP